MKTYKVLMGLAALPLALLVMAAQDTDLSQKEVRDPRYLETWLEANASDAETRLTAAGAIATSDIALTNASNAGTCSIAVHVDKSDDAGDYRKILFSDGGDTVIQTDVSSKGTLATKVTISSAGAVTLASDLVVNGGDITGLGGAIELGEGTPGTLAISQTNILINAASGTLALDSGDWDIGTTGDQTGMGSITMSGTLTFPNSSTIANTAADTMTLTETKVNVAGTLQDDSVAAVVGNHATTQLRVDRGTCTNGQVVAFATWFSAVPTIVIGAAESTTTVPYFGSATTNGFTAAGEAGKSLRWIAVGAR